VAVLHVSPSSGSYARLSLVTLPGGETTTVEGSFDYLSTLAWSPDGSRVAVRSSTAVDESGRRHATVSEIDATTGAVAAVAEFDAVFEVAPVGYSIDGQRLLIVVIDQSGSTLWSERDGRLQKLAAFSPGRTLSWALNPDGSRLAYIDVLGAGERAYAGRTLTIATGAVTDTPSFDDQLGAAWLPGSEIPSFGGPGGSVRLSPEAREAGYVVPEQWSPDGSTLVATIYPANSDRSADRSGSIELVSPQGRIRLSDEAGASFLGWVRNVE
jgi:Tol biopolymer transport system component